jgi:hypothetical protein
VITPDRPTPLIEASMALQRSSYWKAVVIGGTLLASGFLAEILAWRAYAGPLAVLAAVAGLLVLLVGLVLFAAAVTVVIRDRRLQTAHSDLFVELNTSRSEGTLTQTAEFRAGRVRRLAARWLLGHDFLVNDTVEIRSLEEIRSTLDEHGCLEGLPFMPEMTKFAGRRARILRSVDKIYDYGRTRDMRHLKGCVLLSALRCDGTQHGECQAGCYLLWKIDWLKRPAQTTVPARSAAGSHAPHAPPTVAATPGITRFVCQFTQLHAATQPLGRWDFVQDLRPLIAGNVTLGAFLVAIATRVFNAFQAVRGAVGFPVLATPQGRKSSEAAHPLSSGDAVQVRSADEIIATLDRRGKHRGLWFDRDMVKYCGRNYRVLGRVERIIDDATGEMRVMKTPCILLDGTDSTGEYLRFNAQHDLLFWREDWLRRESSSEPTAPA